LDIAIIEKEIGFKLETIASIGPRGLRPRELEVLYVTASEVAPKVVVEVGSYCGVSSVVLGHVVKGSGGTLYCIEPYPPPKLYGNLRRFGVAGVVKVVKAASPRVDIVTLGLSAVHYLLIDGDHKFESVLADYRFWSKLVVSGGRVAFHDYYSHIGVRQALKEIQGAGGKLKQIAIGGVKEDIEPGLIVFEKY